MILLTIFLTLLSVCLGFVLWFWIVYGKPIPLQPKKLIEKYGPWALVTGGAQGIGLAIATSLAKRGMNIILVDIKGDLAQKEADQLEIRHGIKTKVVELDLSREDADAVLFKKLADFWNDQKIGTVILNHAVSKRSTFFNVAPEDINPKFQANAGSYTRLSLAFAKHMSTRFMNRLLGNENARASIVFMSSASVETGTSYFSLYAANKGWQAALAKCLWYELRDDKRVDVSVVFPSAVNTPGLQNNSTSDLKTLGFFWNKVIMLDPTPVAEEIVDGIGRAFVIRPGLIGKLAHLFSFIVGDKLAAMVVGLNTDKFASD